MYRFCLSWVTAVVLCGAGTSWAQGGGPGGNAGQSAPLAAAPSRSAADPSLRPTAAPPRAAQAASIENRIRTIVSAPDVLSGPGPDADVLAGPNPDADVLAGPSPGVDVLAGVDPDADVPAGPDAGFDVLSGAQPGDRRRFNPAPDRALAGEPVTLAHARVTDTARLQVADTSVSLFGIEGFAGEPARQLQDFLAADGDPVTCRPQSAGGFVCLTPDGTDIARMALANGAARTRAEAPAPYLEQERAAQAARRGIWASLPPLPDMITHPIVRDTATLEADGRTYVLDGIIGFAGVYASQLQAYIAASGDSLTCVPQGAPGHYVCVLPDGTDIAMVALVNGAAQVAPDAPTAYRLQQSEAINNRRGTWLSAAEPVQAAALAATEPSSYALPPGDGGADGIVYAGGAPVAVIENVPVFLTFTAGLGWGYYDRFHHWRPAPERYRAHMQRFHPAGRGLRGHGGYGAGMPSGDSAMRSALDPGMVGYGPPRHVGPPEPWTRPGPPHGHCV